MTSNLAMIERRRPRPVRSGHQVCAPMVACVAATNEIDCRSRLGVAPAPDGELGLAESSGDRHAVEMRARRMLEVRIKFIGHPDFDDATADGRDPRPDARAGRSWQGPGKGPGPRDLPLIRRRFPGLQVPDARAGGPPVPQDELPQVSGRPAPRGDQPEPGPLRRSRPRRGIAPGGRRDPKPDHPLVPQAGHLHRQEVHRARSGFLRPGLRG